MTAMVKWLVKTIQMVLRMPRSGLLLILSLHRLLMSLSSDDYFQGMTEELDLSLGSDSDESEDEKVIGKKKKSKQLERPSKIIPTGSTSSGDSDNSEDEELGDGPVTMSNMEKRSRALDAQALHEAELEMQELQEAAAEDEEMADEGAGLDEDGEVFTLPTSEEREEEKKRGGPEVHIVQRRMRECVRVLDNFKKLAAPGR